MTNPNNTDNNNGKRTYTKRNTEYWGTDTTNEPSSRNGMTQYNKYKEENASLKGENEELRGNIVELTNMIEKMKNGSKFFGFGKGRVLFSDYEALVLENRAMKDAMKAYDQQFQEAATRTAEAEHVTGQMDKVINHLHNRLKLMERDWFARGEALRQSNKALAKKSWALKALHRLADSYGVFDHERKLKKDAWYKKTGMALSDEQLLRDSNAAAAIKAMGAELTTPSLVKARTKN